MEIILNGGVTTLEQMDSILEHVNGVMVGREAYHNPYLLAEIDQHLFASTAPIPSREQIIAQLIPYINREMGNGIRLNSIVRHILGLFHGEYGGRGFRRYLSEHVTRPNADESTLLQALTFTVHQVY